MGYDLRTALESARPGTVGPTTYGLCGVDIGTMSFAKALL